MYLKRLIEAPFSLFEKSCRIKTMKFHLPFLTNYLQKHRLSHSDSISFALYAFLIVALMFGSVQGLVFAFFLVFATFFVSRMKSNKAFLLCFPLIMIPIFLESLVERQFFGAYNEGVRFLFVFNINALLFIFTVILVGAATFIIHHFQKKIHRPQKAEVVSLAKNLIFIALASAVVFAISWILGTLTGRIFWHFIDYEFWNNEEVVKYGAGYTLDYVESGFRCVFALPVAYICILCLKKNFLNRLSRRMVYLILFLFTICTELAIAPIGGEMPCFWNPLEDTKHSASFKPENVPLVKIGMTKEEVLALVGEPFRAKDSKNHYAIEDDFRTADFFDYTGDAASFFADFGWYEFSVQFDSEGKASEITSRWMDD